MKIYVDHAVGKSGDGSREKPFLTIQEAAEAARPGDEVLVMPGIYRENVNPVHAGTPEKRIVYRSAEPLKAVITGAEPVRDWTPAGEGSTVYTARVPNSLFGVYNPYTTLVRGDWFIATFIAHTGDVFLNGKSMYEVTSRELVSDPVVSKSSWDPEFSLYTWYSEQDTERDETVFYANFRGADPNRENVEITVRANCFYPQSVGIGYITLSGFTVTQAATQWAPPTAYQEGMVGPHWSKGWIIEDCDISESKCSGISLGKYYQKGNDNKWLNWKYKDGTQTERDCICQAQAEGWNRERIGSHIIRRCNIHDCGQTGIVGHLGGVFSLIEDNHIHHINNKQNLAGAEIGGIKLHAAIDVIIRRNHIHNCTRGVWLDWQAQGTRVSCNLFHDNDLPRLPEDSDEPADYTGVGEDLFIEVSHGPTLVDNNLFLSDRAVKIAAQGVALVHNLVAGGLVSIGIGTNNGSKTISSPRYTPYHMRHRTEIAGFMTILHGDDRFYNNVFVQQPLRPGMRKNMEESRNNHNEWDDGNLLAGTWPFDSYPTYEEWNREFDGYCGMGSAPSDRYYMHLPVWAGGNVYFNGAKPWTKEKDACEDTEHQVVIGVQERDDGWYLQTNLYDFLPKAGNACIDTATLGMAFEPEEKYENPDGTPITFDTDYFRVSRKQHFSAGPFADRESADRKLWNKERP
ncbi:MAG: right-handed parallel beta-helix repeat-containing protein [Lachnospiraceae bacterium]|jgi:hypothetical protein|nr:right-handed parallel beta-helix repeat-containing protein [Lachnospiraceae bacterium]